MKVFSCSICNAPLQLCKLATSSTVANSVLVSKVPKAVPQYFCHPCSCDVQGWTPLHHLCRDQHSADTEAQLLKLLLDGGASVHTRTAQVKHLYPLCVMLRTIVSFSCRVNNSRVYIAACAGVTVPTTPVLCSWPMCCKLTGRQPLACLTGYTFVNAAAHSTVICDCRHLYT